MYTLYVVLTVSFRIVLWAYKASCYNLGVVPDIHCACQIVQQYLCSLTFIHLTMFVS